MAAIKKKVFKYKYTIPANQCRIGGDAPASAVNTAGQLALMKKLNAIRLKLGK